MNSARLGRSGRERLWSAAGVALLVALWAAWSASQPEILVPSPGETARAAWRLASQGELAGPLLLTSGRALYGVVVASALGIAWGLLSARSPALEHLGRPLLSVALTVPPVLLVVVGLVWFGPGVAVVRFVTVVVTLPLLASASAEAVRALDRDLLEMARAFAVPRLHVLRHVVGPAIAGPVLAALTVAIGHGLRVAVMAELLAARDGVGNRVALARTNLDTAQLFAWAVIMVATLLVVEAVVLRPVARRALRWRGFDRAAAPA